MLENINLLTSVSLIALAGVIYLQLKTLHLTRKCSQELIRLKSKLFHMTSTVQTKQLNEKRMQQTAVRGTKAIESVHTTIAGATFDAMEALSPSEASKASTKTLRELHDLSAKGIYQTATEVNKQVGGLADKLLRTGKSKRSKAKDSKKDK